jgi:hypothetical protein
MVLAPYGAITIYIYMVTCVTITSNIAINLKVERGIKTVQMTVGEENGYSDI